SDVAQALQIGGVQGMNFAHNTLKGITMGTGTKSGDSPNSGWTVENNLFDGADQVAAGDQAEGCGAGCIMRYNLESNGGSTSPAGTNSIAGTAVYVGSPQSFANWSNWQLAAGSPGKAAGNDGQDMGTTYFGTAPQVLSAPTLLHVVQ